MDKLRLDKWLWAARFFKTRSLAKQAIEGGKVQLDGQRVKVSKEIVSATSCGFARAGTKRTCRYWRCPTSAAAPRRPSLLYEESEDSLRRREEHAAARKAAGGMLHHPVSRPTKKQRRQIHRFKQDI